MARLKPPIKIMETHTTTKTQEALLRDVDKLKQNAGKVVQDVREHASAHIDETKQRVADTFQTARDTLTAHPFYLLGIGFAAGLFLGSSESGDATLTPE